MAIWNTIGRLRQDTFNIQYPCSSTVLCYTQELFYGRYYHHPPNCSTRFPGHPMCKCTLSVFCLTSSLRRPNVTVVISGRVSSRHETALQWAAICCRVGDLEWCANENMRAARTLDHCMYACIRRSKGSVTVNEIIIYRLYSAYLTNWVAGRLNISSIQC